MSSTVHSLECLHMGYKFIDLFAGVGGIRLGFETHGAECVYSSEWDIACQEVYRENFGEIPDGDITKVKTNAIPDHDILTGGFPCQTFSIIGHRRGFDDTRGTLFFDIARILEKKRPKAFLLENVKQLVGHDKGRTFQVIIKTLNELGYHVRYKILNGLNFGVPQKRERVIIVGFLDNIEFNFPTGPIRKIKSLEDILLPDNKVDKKFILSDYYKEKINKRLKKVPIKPAIWHENKSGNIGVHPFSCALRANASHNYLTVNGERRLTPREMFRLQGFPDIFKLHPVDHQARKQAGNSVVVPMMEAVANEIIKSLNAQKKGRYLSVLPQIEIFEKVAV